MTASSQTRQMPARRNLLRLAHLTVALSICVSCAPIAHAQISLTTAVDLALGSNPRVQGAQANVDKARAQLAETHDVYVPSVNAGAAIGQSYGYSPYPPTLFTVSGGSLVYNASQISYIRSANAGVAAAQLALDDVRESVAEDTALAFVTLDHDRQREQVVGQQASFANTLVDIVRNRLDAGQDAPIDLTQARLTAAQLHLVTLRAADETALDREHLARLIGLPPTALAVDGSFPSDPIPLDAPSNTTVHGYANYGVASAFDSAEAKRQQARGDARFRFHPQINLFATYNYYATFSDSFAQLQKVYQANNNGQSTLSSSEGAFGIQITLPISDRLRAAKARESAADAAHALHEAQAAQSDALDGQSRLRHSIAELQAQAEVAELQRQYAQQQLEILEQQLKSGNPDGPQMTPKDEQKARIDEREKYLSVLDANFQLRQAEIHLLRQTGELIHWLKSSVGTAPSAAPTPQP
jgi:outer membrane protein TolC